MTQRTLRIADHGLTHCYIGRGKGKTTAAVGVAVRARGYGWRVAFVQFMKEERWPSGERSQLRKLGVDVRVLGSGFYRIMGDRKPAIVHRRAAQRALSLARRLVLSGRYQLVILDELGTALDVGLLARAPVEAMLRQRSKRASARPVHVIMTGHERIPWLLKHCDLVTEMRKVKHPFDAGLIATKGIDY